MLSDLEMTQLGHAIEDIADYRAVRVVELLALVHPGGLIATALMAGYGSHWKHTDLIGYVSFINLMNKINYSIHPNWLIERTGGSPGDRYFIERIR